jgi:hypothetical protein
MRVVSRKVHRLLGDRHPLGWSVFVNHTHEDLVERHGLKRPGEEAEEAQAARRRHLKNLRKRTETAERNPPRS